MASERLFKEVPPFPHDVPTAEMVTVALASLNQSLEAADAGKRILDACQKDGFFLLDLHGDPLGETVIQEVDQLFDASTGIMNLPDEVKKNYQYGLLGFKPRGISTVESGEPDRFEWLNLGQDGLLGISPPQSVPELVLTSIPIFTSFLRHGQEIASVVFRSLATSLSLPPSTFTDQHPLSKRSGTVVRCLRVPAFTGSTTPPSSMVQHTDFGTITLLANVAGGLQIRQPQQHEVVSQYGWRYIRPRPGHLIVNLGDVMVGWTDEILRSALHRVNHAPGQQSAVDRYSLGIFVRPQRDASIKSLMRKAKAKTRGDGNDNNGKDEKEDDEDKDEKSPTVYEWEVQRAMALMKDQYRPQIEIQK